MSSFTIKIDGKRCNQCGLCVKDCISGCICLENDKPSPVNKKWCNLCSHCIAICPKGAIEHTGLSGMPPRSIKDAKLDPEAYKKIVTSRRSIRRFKDKEVPLKTIEEILHLAAYSPTASNEMDVGYTVVTDKRIVRKTGLTIYKKFERIMKILKKPPFKLIIALLNKYVLKKSVDRYLDRQELFSSWVAQGLDVITHDAPVMILIHGPRKGRFMHENSSIAACNITNYAHAKGLGTCYIGFISALTESMQNKIEGLKVPQGRKIYIALILGYPAHRYQNTTIRPEPEIDWIG